jgi:hypothetical protein
VVLNDALPDLFVIPRRQLRDQVRPVAFDNAAQLMVDGLDGVEAFDLQSDLLKLLRFKRAALVELDGRHVMRLHASVSNGTSARLSRHKQNNHGQGREHDQRSDNNAQTLVGAGGLLIAEFVI